MIELPHEKSLHAAESVAALTAKASPPVAITVASIGGVPVADLVLWGTLVYTGLMISHKLYQIYRDVRAGLIARRAEK